MKKIGKGLAGATAVLGITVYECWNCSNILRKPLSSAFMSNRKCEFIYIRVSLIDFDEKINNFVLIAARLFSGAS